MFILFACKKNDSEPESEESNYKTYYGSIGNNDNSTIVSSDDNLIICGMNYENDLSLIKTTKSEQQLWRKDISFDDDQFYGCSLTEVANGEIFVCGTTEKNIDVSEKDILLVKTNPFGDTLWTKTYGTLNEDHGQNIISTSDGNLLLSGFTAGSDTIESTGVYVLKINTFGDTLWTKRFNTEGVTLAFHLLETSNGEFLISGTFFTEGYNTHEELYLLKVDAQGTKLWEQKFELLNGARGSSAIELTNGDLVICGTILGQLWTNNVLLMKTDNLGNVIWSRSFGEEQYSAIGTSVKQNQDGSFSITGNTGGSMGTEIILLKVDHSGNQVWLKKYRDQGYNKGSNLIKDSNDDNLITGNLDVDGKPNIFLTRMDNDGNFKK